METGTAFLLVHHIRKPGELGVSTLDDTPALEWLNQACGARALINQTDFRLGIDRRVGPMTTLNSTASEQMALVIRGHIRVRGDFGPVHLSRVYDDHGAERGYRKLVGADMLTPEEKQVWAKLPDNFAFKDARSAYNSISKKGDQGIADFLRKCISVDLLVQPMRRGPYEKSVEAGSATFPLDRQPDFGTLSE